MLPFSVFQTSTEDPIQDSRFQNSQTFQEHSINIQFISENSTSMEAPMFPTMSLDPVNSVKDPFPQSASNPMPNRPSSFPQDLRPEANMILASQQSGAIASGAYAWRPPSPPHIHVPQAPEDVELALPSYSGSGYGYSDADREILRMLTQKRHAKLGVRDWKYENRRAAQSILSFLYLGPSAAARDVDYLRQEGITMLLVIRDTKTAMARLLSGDKAAAALGIESAAVDVAGSQELIAAFPKAINIINEHLIRVYKQTVANGAIPNRSNRGKVMVFCESGNERSAAVLAAYIMATYGTDLVAAIQYVQSQRFCVAFDDGLKNLLLNYQDLLYAQKSVIASYLTPEQCGPSMPAKSKRRREDTQDDDEDFDMDRADDQERFGERSSFVPFRDGGDAFSLAH